MNRYFIFWYYVEGIQSVFSLFRNFLRFIAHRFNVIGLLSTLISPWKRDMSFHNWRGLHPLLFLKMLFNNFISRFLGMLVRFVMLVAGILLMILVFAAGAPFFIVFGFVMFPLSQIYGIGSLLFGIFGFGTILFVYTTRKEIKPLTFDIRELRKMKFFKRLLARLGLVLGSFKKETLRDTETFLAFLETLGIERLTYERAAAVEHWLSEKRAKESSFWLWENLGKIRPLGKDWHYAYTPHLDRYCLDLAKYDLTEYGQAELVGRRDELQVATVVLERPTQNSVILVSDPGVGKKTFVHYFARLVRENTFADRFLNEARVLLFDIGRAISDAVNRGEDPEHLVRSLFTEVAYAGNVILAIENIDEYLVSHSMRHNLAPLFNEFLQLASFRVMATASTNNYHALAKESEQVLKFFDVIYLREPSDSETLDILIRHFERLERKRVVFTMRGLETIIASADRFDWAMPLPERAIDLAQEVLLYWQKTDESFITPETVDNFVTIKTGAPSGAIKEDEKEKLLHLEEALHRRVIGQNEAVKQVAEAMRKARAGFGNDKRPLGSFIFFGPSGVGKTETAKAFAENYFGNEDKMIRLDMSEFQTTESIDRMIGSREKNVYGELVTAAREHPFSILLLDEIEKAYPRALDLFLQILDEGYVTDGFGEKASFRNMVIIATSNAGAPLIKELVRENTPITTIRKRVLDHIIENNIFRLEFLSRFDGIIFFEPLEQKELEAVAKLKLEKFAERLKKEKNITINFSPDVVPKIVEKGFEPEFGMRSLVRFIEDAIEDAVVKKIIAGELAEGGEFDFSGDEL
jgi:ATP-dependent Clp protease ATP-binding subunit ClpA